MPNVVRTGLVLGLLVEVWTAVVIAAGWHKDPALMLLFFVVIPLQVVMVVGALRREAATAGYGRQVVNALGMSAVAAVVVAVGSFLLTTVVFPRYFDDLRQCAEEMFRASGMPAEAIAAELEKNAPMQKPLPNSLLGATGTIVTGLVTGLIAALFVRRKG